MKLSVLLTCYNCQEYIDKAIQSVVHNHLPFEWELLIGDDGSSDGSLERIRKWEKQFPNNIRVFIRERKELNTKSSIRAARNRAALLEEAKGEFLAFLDGDDELIGSDKFCKQVELLEKPENKNCSCAAHNILVNDLGEGKKYPLSHIESDTRVFTPNEYWKKFYFHTNTILFRAQCKQIMLEPKYRDFLNDNFITFLIIQSGNIFYSNDLMAQYNVTGNGLWTGKKRTFGCFRNLMIYDLEITLNPSMKHEAYFRHLYDFIYIIQHYKRKNDLETFDMVANFRYKDFPHTYLLSHDKLSFFQWIRKCLIYSKARLYYVWPHILQILYHEKKPKKNY